MYQEVIEGLISRTRLSDYAFKGIPFVDSKSQWKKLIKKQKVLVNGEIANSGTWLDNGSLLEVKEQELSLVSAYKMDLDILYEDGELFVVDKPSGIIVSGNRHRTIENALLYHFTLNEESISYYPRCIHRLDSQTSGLLVGARTRHALLNLQSQFSQHAITKEYLTIVHGCVPEQMNISLPINEKSAFTETKRLKVIESNKYSAMSLVLVRIEEGRTHQIRIHLSSLGHPVIGDKLYNSEITKKIKGLYLHSWRIKFLHPSTKKIITIKSPIPERFKKFGISRNDLPQF